jgi:DeoR/GlpR family transcriptional regulator of sugar metabolism
MAVIGGWALDAIYSIRVDIAFLGTDGFINRDGPCSASFEEVDIKKAMIKQSKQKILLADHSKFFRDDLFTYSEWRDIDCLITDDKAPADELSRIGKYTKIIVFSPGKLKTEDVYED